MNCLMKSYLRFSMFTALVTAMALTSCSRDLSDSEGGIPIEFVNEYVVEVRSGDREAGFQTNDKIGVLAYYVPSGEEWDEYKSGAKPDFMYNVPLSYDGTSWSYSPVMYWPQKKGARLNFYTYYPYTPYAEFDENNPNPIPGVYVSSDETAGEPSFKFILNESADVDLMVATNEDLTAETGPVVLNFKHLLSKVQFGFNVSNDGGFSYIVNQIKVNGTPIIASYSWDSETFHVDQTGSVIVYAGDEGEDHLIDSTEPRIVDDFTMFLMPGTLGEIEVSINNEEPKTVTIDTPIDSGVELTVNLEVDLTGIKFTTSVADWQDGGTATGGIS